MEEEEGQTEANGGGLSDYCWCQLYDRLTVMAITIPGPGNGPPGQHSHNTHHKYISSNERVI